MITKEYLEEQFGNITEYRQIPCKNIYDGNDYSYVFFEVAGYSLGINTYDSGEDLGVYYIKGNGCYFMDDVQSGIDLLREKLAIEVDKWKLLGEVEFLNPIIDVGSTGYLYYSDLFDDFYIYKLVEKPACLWGDKSYLITSKYESYIPVNEVVPYIGLIYKNMGIFTDDISFHDVCRSWTDNKWRFKGHCTWLDI